MLEGERPLHKLAHEWTHATPGLVGILQRNRNRWTTLIGQDHLVQRLGGLRWHVGAGSFFQVNDRQAARLIDLVSNRMEARPGQRLLDLFCGVGTFALPLAHAGAAVIGIESYTQAIEDARRSAMLNAITGIEWHAGPVEALLGGFRGPFDGAVLDPPRRGCEPTTLRELLRLHPTRIVYVSCHPGTLARDCKILCAGGYRITRAEAVDLFPQTHHIESIVTLEAGP